MMFHFFADDSQIYLSFDSDTPELITISKFGDWMSFNKLKLNSEKTELLLIGSKFRPRPQLSPVNISGDLIRASMFARNIGVIFDSHMTSEHRVSNVCKTFFSHIRNVARIRKYLSVENKKTSIHSFVTCRLDHGNALLYGLPK